MSEKRFDLFRLTGVLLALIAYAILFVAGYAILMFVLRVLVQFALL